MRLLNGNPGRTIRRCGLVALSGLLLSASQLGWAQDEYVVSYSNIELETLEGLQEVHARIVAAAKNYCPTYSQIRSTRDVKTCVDGVVKDLVTKIAHPRLTSCHTGSDEVRVATIQQRKSLSRKTPRT